MPHRAFRDDRGLMWEVWEVNPTAVERRKRSGSVDPSTVSERRERHEVRRIVSDALQKGWLAFQSTHERRRLAPTPVGWTEMSDAELLELLASARPVGRPRRLIE